MIYKLLTFTVIHIALLGTTVSNLFKGVLLLNIFYTYTEIKRSIEPLEFLFYNTRTIAVGPIK